MGIFLSRVRKKKSTIEVLEKLENDIKEIEENRSDAQRKYKKITKLFLIYSTGLYILFGIFFYYYFSSTYREKLLYLVPLALSPLILYIVKRIISWYYIRLINKNQIRLNEMKKEKKKILDEVMEKETYKVAKEILDKFSNEKPKPIHITPINPLSNDAIRKRTSSTSNAPLAKLPSNIINNISTNQPLRPISSSPMPHGSFQAPGPPKLWMPAPILPLNRSYMDKVVEYLIGDGPNNRYALICSKCHSHNGMALKEEFEYIGYKCCYCYQYNPARKVRPEAPRLESPMRLIQDPDSDSDSKTPPESSDTDTDTDTKAILNSCDLTNTKTLLEPPNAQDSETLVNSTDWGRNETDKTSEANEKAVDSKPEGENHEETTNEDNVVEEPSSSNQADDANCDESLLKS